MKPIKLNKKLIPLFILLSLALLSAVGIFFSQYFEKTETLEMGSETTVQSEVEQREGAQTLLSNDDLSSDEETKSFAVFITGAAQRPGVYYLDEGARIDDALKIAGGATSLAHLPSVNLAAPVHDAMHIYIPTKEEVKNSSFNPLELVSSYKSLEQKEQEAAAGAPATSSSTPKSFASGGKINVNKANATELELLPGVGPATAQKIIDERTKNGAFINAEDLLRVSGIGEKKLESMRDSLAF